MCAVKYVYYLLYLHLNFVDGSVLYILHVASCSTLLRSKYIVDYTLLRNLLLETSAFARKTCFAR